MGQSQLRQELDQIFGAFVRQESLESAAEEMAEASKEDAAQHLRFTSALSFGVEAARAGDVTICQCVERSGYYARSITEAEDILVELQKLYMLRAFQS